MLKESDTCVVADSLRLCDEVADRDPLRVGVRVFVGDTEIVLETEISDVMDVDAVIEPVKEPVAERGALSVLL